MNCYTLLVVLLAQQLHAAPVIIKTWYHQYMTPDWIMNNAMFIHSSGSVSNNQLKFSALTKGAIYTQLVKVNLISPGVLDDNEDITVKIVVSMDRTIGMTKDSDIMFLISDTVHSLGGITMDKANLDNGYSPCSGFQGKSGSVLTAPQFISYKKGTVYTYPAEYTFRLKLRQRWGSCFASVSGGFTNIFKYMHKLKQSNGLDLEIYKQDIGEEVGIKYVIVTITQEN